MRSVLSAMLVLVIALGAEAAIPTPVPSGHAAQCAARTVFQVCHHAMPVSCKRHASPAPCCPSHSLTSPATCLDRPGCCTLSNLPARPSAFLIVSRGPLSLDLSATRSAGVDRDLSWRSLRANTSDSPPFLRPVFDRKADLRI